MNVLKQITLDTENRIKSIQDLPLTSCIVLNVSRDKCNDVLLELIDETGQAKGKPLHKFIPEIKLKKPVKAIRFTMNNFSTRPITISLSFK